MSPTEERLQALLDKWVASLEAHLRYAALSEEAYWQVQAWAPHQRPGRWIIELALSRAVELRRELTARREAGDEAFAGAMELMSFLANLVGSENISRFIPLADPASERAPAVSVSVPPPPSPVPAAPPVMAPAAPRAVRSLLDDPTGSPRALEVTREMPLPALIAETSATREMPRPPVTADLSATREMPRPAAKNDSAETRAMPRPKGLKPPAQPPPEPAPAPPGTADAAPPVLRSAPPPESSPPPPAPAVPPIAPELVVVDPAAAAATTDGPASDEVVNIVIADAIRLRKWGREWHELANTIARMAGRPELSEIRRILRTHKADIEAGTPRRPPAGGA